jgi:hypothetical protein
MVNYGGNAAQTITIRKLKILHTDGFSGYYFATTKANHYFLLEHCYFAEGVDGFTCTNNFFRCDYGFIDFVVYMFIFYKEQ